MKYFDHGGGVARAARELGLPPASILDFSASINPLGIPPEVLRTAREALDEAVHYPEIDASSLTEALAEYHGIPVENILPGSGSTELLYLFPRVLQPRRALLVTPAFTEYERSLNQAGTALEIYPLVPETGFHLDPERLLQHLEPDIDLILLANPGNPMGSTIPPETIAEIAHAVREQALVAVDEAFVDFCPQFSVLPQLLRHGYLYVFRSLTKFYAIPGGLQVGNAPGRTGEVTGSKPRDGVKLGQGAKNVKISVAEKLRQDRELRAEIDKSLVHGHEGLFAHRMGDLSDRLRRDGAP
ncbi:MAG: aminotransferase class I/II-fold pyridoxal phosphate-dependent enzyme, partial [Desulfuromonadales bacterium]